MIKNSNITNEQKEKRLQEIDFTSITSTRGNPVVGHICINPTKNMYNRLIENSNNFFFVPLVLLFIIFKISNACFGENVQ